jgi:hypothetical protein
MTPQIVIGPALALVITGAGAAFGQGREPMTVDIGQLAPNLEPELTQWRTGEGDAAEWTLVADASAEGGRAIAQVSKDKTNYRFPLAIYEPFSGRDLEVLVRFKPVAGTVDQAGGIAIRMTSPDEYYVARANALEDNVRFYRVVRGRREQLHGADLKVASGQWHTLGLQAKGTRFTVSFNGKTLFTAEDNTFAGPGKVALWTKADSVTHFDTIAITPLD